ncbi:MAG: MerR family transcriptional regulator [Acidobacteria bacterium OLB17]|nr:MAG: MerR family transcriptional regulator [Acidobacteria bacterium OLB17]MCZ2391869.1 MerR family transcriptional regulator [Acidobacteriota bacterium]
MVTVDNVIPDKIFFKIGEVCELVGVQAHVLRYWETEFPTFSPQKNKSGQRSYRRKDVEIALKIKQLLYKEMFTIAGARQKLQAEARAAQKPEKPPAAHDVPKPTLSDIPTLFDSLQDDGTLESIAASSGLTPEQRKALRRLAAHLVELREMLARDIH